MLLCKSLLACFDYGEMLKLHLEPALFSLVALSSFSSFFFFFFPSFFFFLFPKKTKVYYIVQPGIELTM